MDVLERAKRINEAKRRAGLDASFSGDTLIFDVIEDLCNENHKFANRITGLQLALENLLLAAESGDHDEWRNCVEIALMALGVGGE